MMNEDNFLKKMVEIMDTEEVLSMDTVLENLEEWDSLSYISFLTMCKAEGKKVLPDDIRRAKKIQDLYMLIK